MVNVTIDGKKIQVPERTRILDAARMAGVRIPTLCYWEGLNEIGACRVCVVEVEGYNKLFTACNNTVDEGMVIHTNSKKAWEARRTNVQLILSEHNSNCATCIRSGNCELQTIANDMGITEVPFEHLGRGEHRRQDHRGRARRLYPGGEQVRSLRPVHHPLPRGRPA